MSNEISEEKKEIKGSYFNKMLMPLNIVCLLMLLAAMMVDGIGVIIFVVTVSTYGVSRAIFNSLDNKPPKINPYIIGTLITLLVGAVLSIIAYIILKRIN